MSGIFATPRPAPSHRLPALGGAAAIALALPVFLAADWPVSGWTLGAVLWLAAEGLGLVLTRFRPAPGNLARSSVQGIGMMFRVVAVMVVLVAVAASDAKLALGAGLVYALGYTVELTLSLLSYFGAQEST